MSRPELTVRRILRWADAWRARTGRWPLRESGPVPESPGDTWMAVNMALGKGHRGLPGGSSLARLLAEHRGYRNIHGLPRLTLGQIVAWADAHRGATGRWPTADAGPVWAAPGESWACIDQALRNGGRGLPGADSLARLLARRRGVRNPRTAPRLTQPGIVAWAERYRRQTGRWPTARSGPVPGAPGETWQAVDSALRAGQRGLRGGSSLAKLLRRRRGAMPQGNGSPCPRRVRSAAP
jgi:hypothetical protein